ncbi:Late secretory pathway protein AVL9 [Dirofilaria immitis]|nr:Late secretory pathway protein AVL9 [Dirofilaria immitis]
MVSSILYVAVIGFHHKRGCQIEYCYPPLTDGKEELPAAWQNLPSLALPDGAHNVDHGTCNIFLLPSLDDPNQSIFGISCYRQISAKYCSKSVCVLSRVPLFGVLTAKLQLITKAYFNERDFAKVDVLSQMYENLCEMFPDSVFDEQAAVMDISVQSLVTTFRHRVLVLFKLLLLEKKVVFYISPVFHLSQLMVALISLFPQLVEKGLFHAAAYDPNSLKCSNKNKNVDEDEIFLEMGEDILEDEILKSEDIVADVSVEKNKVSGSNPVELVHKDLLASAMDCVSVECYSNLKRKQILATDSYGFPLSIFTKGSLFHPYLSICHLDMIRSDKTRAYCIGATNALFVQRRDLLDVIVTVDEGGDGSIDIVDVELKRSLALTAADLRFVDFLLKEMEANAKSPSWEGSDDWIRLQMQAYLLSLIATVRADLKDSLDDFNEAFITEWKMSNNYRIWSCGDYPDLASAVPGHPFAGGLGISDVLLRMEHSVGGTGSGRRVASAVVNTSKYFADTGTKVKTSIASWLKGTRSTENLYLIVPTVPMLSSVDVVHCKLDSLKFE